MRQEERREKGKKREMGEEEKKNEMGMWEGVKERPTEGNLLSVS